MSYSPSEGISYHILQTRTERGVIIWIPQATAPNKHLYAYAWVHLPLDWSPVHNPHPLAMSLSSLPLSLDKPLLTPYIFFFLICSRSYAFQAWDFAKKKQKTKTKQKTLFSFVERNLYHQDKSCPEYEMASLVCQGLFYPDTSVRGKSSLCVEIFKPCFNIFHWVFIWFGCF